MGAWIGPQDVACNISYTMALRSWTLAGQSWACMMDRERGRPFSACLSSLLLLLQVGRGARVINVLPSQGLLSAICLG